MQHKREPRSPGLLPPIGNGDSAACSSQPRGDEDNCHRLGATSKQSHFMDWFSTKVKKKKSRSEKESRQIKTRSLASPTKDEDENDIVKYLDKNIDFLDSYVLENVPLETLEKWLQKKLVTNVKPPSLIDQYLPLQLTGNSCDKQTFLNLLSFLKDEPTEYAVLWKLATEISTLIEAAAYRIYKVFPDHPNFVQYLVMDEANLNCPKLMRVDPDEVQHILAVIKNGTCVKMRKEDISELFQTSPETFIKEFTADNSSEEKHVLYIPLLTKNGKTSYILEMWKIVPFTDIEVQKCSTFLVWGSLALHFCNMYLDKKRERNMSDFLLDVVKAIFEEMVSLDQLIKRILEFAQKLVNADRASLFLVDYRNFELVSTVFDLKFEPGLDRDMEKKEIRMPINRGIAGHVALSGETMNIPDAYSDYRFNREVDEATGYKTISILCMPIKVEGRVIGVVQMVNKRDDDNFDHEDEVSFEIFSTFFGLALHHARLYDRIMRKEQKYRVALEVLSYHNTCKENEVQAMLADKHHVAVNLNDFYLDPFKFNEFEKCKCVVTMFNDLFDLSNFDITTVIRFILTVKKNYRTVPYHNFDHGWSVAHAMYVILKNDKKRFNYNMRLALFVACLCHDLDHRGYTNKYMSETASPLAAMYTTSTLEHHHFNITVTILQQDGHNIFSHITSEDYKEILGYIRQCILATDLAAFFPNLEKIKDLCGGKSSQKFSWTLPNHRDLAMAISMTAADLSASAKPWEIQNKTVKVIFEEFYDQGDKERAAGRTPIPMMDRNKPEEQPASQVGFLSQICIPCYQMLYKILPNTKPMLGMAMKNLDRWQAKADRISRKLKRKKTKNIKDVTENEGKTSEESSNDRKESAVVEKSESLSWEEEENVLIDEMKLKNAIKQDDGVTSWIEEDDEVVVAKTVLRCIAADKDKK